MSKIEDLIKQYCPNGVEWKKLGDVEQLGWIELGRGQVLSKSYIQDNPGNFPVFSSAATNNGVIGRCNTYMFTDSRITWSIDGGGKFFYRNDSYYSVTNVCGWLRVNDFSVLNLRYLYFALMNEWSKKTFDYVHKAHPSVIREEYIIPIPHIAVQEEIVRILDKFTELEKELEKELELRRKQYEFYRDKLLTFGDDVERKRLGDVTNVCRGKRVVKRELSDSVGHPVYQNSLSILGYYMDSNYPANTSFVIGAGAAGEIGYSLTDFWAADDCFPIICKGTLLDRFVFYFLMQNQAVLKSKVRKASIPRLSRDEIENLIISIPSPTEQERIVKILDKFDTLTTSLTSGLPAEIKLRKQQYEYYRDYLFGLLK